MNCFVLFCHYCIIISSCQSETVFTPLYKLRGVMKQFEENSNRYSVPIDNEVQIYESQPQGQYKIDGIGVDNEIQTISEFKLDEVSVKLMLGKLIKIRVNNEQQNYILTCFFSDGEHARYFYQLINPETALQEVNHFDVISLDVYNQKNWNLESNLGHATLYQTQLSASRENYQIFLVKLQPSGIPYMYFSEEQFALGMRDQKLYFKIDNRSDSIYVMDFNDTRKVADSIWKYANGERVLRNR